VISRSKDLVVDLALYLGSAIFALGTAVWATLPPHRLWGQISWYGYAGATVIVGTLLAVRRPVARLSLTVLVWAAVAITPLIVEAAQGRAQDEVIVVERAGQRLLDTGTPYLTRAAIAALPPDERLLGYVPYQPGMALFGLPRALAGTAWWTDARVWFALVTAAALAAALYLLRGAGDPVRPTQVVTVLPICALTLAVGGDDLPVLALSLLALALAARGRWLGAGLAVGVAGALKLFAWPVALVLVAYAWTRGRPATAVPALGLPVAALVPAFVVNRSAAVENTVRLPLGHGLVSSPAASPLPGHLIAVGVPGGRTIAAALLVAAALALGYRLVRHPPRDAGAAALFCTAGLLAAILLVPATRFGYLLYPVAFGVWAPLLSRAAPAERRQKV